MPAETDRIELFVLGPTQLVVNGHEVALRPREQSLLATLAYADQIWRDDELTDWAWDAALSRRALTSTIYRVRQAAKCDLFEIGQRTVALRPEVRIDVNAWSEHQEQARRNPADRTSLQAGLGLWRGEAFSSAKGSQWGPVRDSWRQRQIHGAIELSRRTAAEGDLLSAVDVLQSCVVRWPGDVEIEVALAHCLELAGDQRGAVAVVERQRRRLAQRGLTIAPELETLERRATQPTPRQGGGSWSARVDVRRPRGRVGHADTACR
jgi:DNA-binding SARP family transcriptional activator